MAGRKKSEQSAAADGDENKGAVNTGSTPKVGHNSGTTAEKLSDEQLQALFFQTKRKYEAALATKKAADAALRNVCKLAKSELGDTAVDEIKTAILLETEEGEAGVKGRIERELRIARWMALPLGQQADLLSDVDRTPAIDLAAMEGKRDGLAGNPCKPKWSSGTPQYDSYMTAFHEGQAALAKGIRPLPLDKAATEAAEFDKALDKPAADGDEDIPGFLARGNGATEHAGA